MVETRRLWPLQGGLEIEDHKALSNQRGIQDIPVPPRVILPLQQHIGHPAEPLVGPGDRVEKGQLIARPNDYISAPVHASAAGRVVEIAILPVPHPSGLSDNCIVIDTDPQADAQTMQPLDRHFSEMEPAALRERIRMAGIVGLGGAAFPTAVKLNTGGQVAVDTLIINAAECEPYISCDDRLMREHATQIIEGIAILRHLTRATNCLIGIEDNKPEAIASLRAAIASHGEPELAELVVIPSRYPSGGEKQLIHILTGREVPSPGLPAAIGVLCQNVATVAAIADAVLRDTPLIERIVTVTGQGVARPGNFRVPIGTPAAYLIAQAGGYRQPVQQLILGGPMMGFGLHSDQVPITKATNCLLAASPAEMPMAKTETQCIRCGECAAVCPVQLLPQQLYWNARARDFDKVQDYHVFDCIECGCCAYVCPAHIPLVHYFRFAKTGIWAQERDRAKSDLARRRHDARVARIERLETERKAKLRQKKEALAQTADGADDPRKAAIAAAMQRVAAKKAAQQTATDSPPGSD